jgi:hypothetical protein
MPFLPHGPQCLGAPSRVKTAQLTEDHSPRPRRLMGAGRGLTGAFLPADGAVVAIALDPLVTGLAPDVVAFAPLSDRPCLSQVGGETWQLLVHRGCVPPGQRAPPWGPMRLITRSPMSLDQTVTYVSGPYL